VRQRIEWLSGAPLDLAFSMPIVPALRCQPARSAQWCRGSWRVRGEDAGSVEDTFSLLLDPVDMVPGSAHFPNGQR
jgi:hypothetical protein